MASTLDHDWRRERARSVAALTLTVLAVAAIFAAGGGLFFARCLDKPDLARLSTVAMLIACPVSLVAMRGIH